MGGAAAGAPPEPAELAEAVRHVEAGGLLAYPTETVFGLGADAGSEAAVASLRRWKGRDDRAPISILVDGADALPVLGLALPADARALAARFWPGPLTLVIPAPPGRFARGVARADGAVGLRCSPHPVAAGLARALARAGVGPLTATSLNRSGEPPAASAAEAARLLAAHPGPRLVGAETVSQGGSERPSPVSCAAPSTVVDCTGPAFALLREGAIDAPALARAVGARDATEEQEASSR